MKNIKYFASVLALTLSTTAFAAETLDSQTTDGMTKAGVISVSGATTLDTLQAELSAKAEAAGAKTFTITSVSGNNQLHGTADIYN